MTTPQDRGRSIGDDIGHIVGISIFVILVVQAGLSAALAWAVPSGGLKAGPEEYVQFVVLYLSTFALSATLSIAVIVYVIPRMYGYEAPWELSLGVVVAGAVLTSLVYHAPWPLEVRLGIPRNVLILLTFKALTSFAEIYGALFFAGTITGLGGGLILIAITHNRIQNAVTTGSARAREPQSWLGGVSGLILVVMISAVIIIIT